MFFTIKEMAKQLGVTTHKLRYYERMGILEPHVNEQTGYRYYSVRDTRRFNVSRLYRGFGFSISECKELMGGEMSFADFVAALDEQEHSLRGDISLRTDKLWAFAFWKPYIANALFDRGRARQIWLPDFVRLTVGEDEKPIRSEGREELFDRWLNIFPICSWASRIRRRVVEARGAPDYFHTYDYGLNIPETLAKKYALMEDGITEFLPGGMYVYTVFRKDNDEGFNLDGMGPIDEYMERNRLRFAGDALSNCIYSTKEAGEIVNYHYLMVQVTDMV